MANRKGVQRQNSTDLVAQYFQKHGSLGFGDVSNRSTEQYVSRVVLFFLMRKMCRKRVAVFRSAALPLYATLFELGRKQLPLVHSDLPRLLIRKEISPTRTEIKPHLIDGWPALCSAADHAPEARSLKSTMLAWASQSNLEEEWFLDAALFNLRCWHLTSSSDASWEWGFPGSLSLNPSRRFGGHDPGMLAKVKALSISGPTPPEVPIYNPAMQTAEEHWKNLRDALDDYYLKQQEIFFDEDFVIHSEKRRRTGDYFEHMRWFIRFQIQGQAASQCSRKSGTAVIRAVRSIASALATALRSDASRPPQQLKRKSLSR